MPGLARLHMSTRGPGGLVEAGGLEAERCEDPVCHRLLLRARAALQRVLTLEGLELEVMAEGQRLMALVSFLFGDLETAQQKAFRHTRTETAPQRSRTQACVTRSPPIAALFQEQVYAAAK